jgi:hypothetical protein
MEGRSSALIAWSVSRRMLGAFCDRPAPDLAVSDWVTTFNPINPRPMRSTFFLCSPPTRARWNALPLVLKRGTGGCHAPSAADCAVDSGR